MLGVAVAWGVDVRVLLCAVNVVDVVWVGMMVSVVVVSGLSVMEREVVTVGIQSSPTSSR